MSSSADILLRSEVYSRQHAGDMCSDAHEARRSRTRRHKELKSDDFVQLITGATSRSIGRMRRFATVLLYCSLAETGSKWTLEEMRMCSYGGTSIGAHAA